MDFGDSDFLKEEKEDENRKIEIKDALTCFICTAKVLDPMMCPQCKKLVCTKCIKKWFIDQQHEKCPYCQVPSSFDKMINLPFMNQLSEYFIKEIEKKEIEAEKTYIFPKNRTMNINQIIDEDDDDNNNNIKEYNSHNHSFDEKEDNILSKTQFIPNKFNNIENKNKENDLSLSKNFSAKMSLIKEEMKGEPCFKHPTEKIEYYCLNCNTKHCAKCLLIMSKESKYHEGHKIVDIARKNKFNIDNVIQDIKSLSFSLKNLTQYKINIEIEEKIIEKKQDFYKKQLEEFQHMINNRTSSKSTKLDLDKQQIEKQTKQIEGIQNNHKEALINFVDRDDKLGLEEYHNKVINFKDTDKFIHNDYYDIFINPSLKFYETDFTPIEIKENEENIGEIIGEYNYDIEGMEHNVQLRFNQEAIDEILINIQINLENFDEDKISYSCFLILKNKNCITSANLNERMVHNGILILGKTIIKNSLKNIIDENNKCNVKLILSETKM